MTAGSLHGVLPVDKPVGMTSHDVVASARRALGERRIGHTGTLDPFASGLLLLCVGEATRLAEYLTGMDKTYEATVLLGMATDSGDRDGAVLARSDAWREVSRDALDAALARFRGDLQQLPPTLSAKKVAGVPAHRRVRRGEEVTLQPQAVTVHELTVTGCAPPEVHLFLRCSSGTYVRSLARDLGEALGVGAHLTALRRTAVGLFGVVGAVGLADLEDHARVDGALLSPLDALAHLPRWMVEAESAADLGHGRAVDAADAPDAPVAAAVCADRLVALGAIADGRFLPRKVLAHG
ncbi:MAG TPA: tRNA pseudouridine(55) synthase TruB [Longimicrobiales bacterium]|nr:tRNA pseudouridine(55) synthase TruB [Longimicrobiales bacterium]